MIDYQNNTIKLVNKTKISKYETLGVNVTKQIPDVQEVVLDKDGEPFMFEGEVVCVGDNINGETILGYISNEYSFIIATDDPTMQNIQECNINSHTPKHPQKVEVQEYWSNNKLVKITANGKTIYPLKNKHPQKKGIEKIDEREYKATPIEEEMGISVDGRDVKIEKLAEKLNELIDVVNKLKG